MAMLGRTNMEQPALRFALNLGDTLTLIIFLFPFYACLLYLSLGSFFPTVSDLPCKVESAVYICV